MPDTDGRAHFALLAAEAGADLTLVVTWPDARCVYASGSSGVVLGRPHEAVESGYLRDLIDPADHFQLTRALQQAATSRPVSLHVRLVGAEGRRSWVEARVEASSDADALVLTFRNTAALELEPVQVVIGVQQDPLTGVANRTVLLDRAQHALSRLGRERHVVCLMFFDLDHFKAINDSFGHEVGDEILKELCRRITDLLRPSDTLARMGGDEFALLLDDLHSEEEAMALAHRITAAGRQHYRIGGHDISCSVSLGLSTAHSPDQRVEALLRDADAAMYRAKSAGRGRWRSAAGSADGQQRAIIERLLRSALSATGVLVEYQPVVRLQDLRLTGVEALLRIRSDRGEALRPDRFMAVATGSGLVQALDLQVLDRALTDRGAVGRERPSLSVAMNLALEDIEDTPFFESLLESLERAVTPTTGLQFELTERSLQAASEVALRRLSTLRDHGAQVGVDRYGSEGTSLAVLWRSPLDYVKVDRSLIEQATSVRAARAVLRAIVEVAHGLGMEVVAQGIETSEQQRGATRAGCDRGEGYLWPSYWSLTEVLAAWPQR